MGYVRRSFLLALTLAMLIALSGGVSAQNATCEVAPGDFRAHGQGGWGADPQGNNPAIYLASNFVSVFPEGLTIGDPAGFTAHFNTSDAIMNFLPAGGTPGALTEDATNPVSTGAGVLAGQILALSLNVNFDLADQNFSVSNTSLQSLVIADASSACFGMTAQEVLDEANTVLAGLTSNFSPSQINGCVELFNEQIATGDDLVTSAACLNETGGTDGNGTNRTTDVTIHIMKHICDSSIQTEAQFDARGNFSQKLDACPTVVLTGDNATAGAISGGAMPFEFSVAGTDGQTLLLTGADFMQGQLCEDAAGVDFNGDGNLTNSSCMDTSHYRFENISRGAVTVRELNPPAGTRFGTIEFTPGSGDEATLVSISATDARVVLNASNDTDVMLHVYNFRNVGGGGNVTPGGNQTGDGGVPTDGAGARISVKQWYPQFNNYVFVCEADGFTPTRFDWHFGDGEKLLDIENDNVFHTFMERGTYTVSCTAENDQQSATASMTVTVGQIIVPQEVLDTGANASVDVRIAQGYPQGNDYVFVCDASGFDPFAYDWYFGDGEKQIYSDNRDVFHRFTAPGTYEVQCRAANDVVAETGSITVTVTGFNGTAGQDGTNQTPTEQPPTGDGQGTAILSVAEGFPQGADYVFVCNATGFEATSYDFDFGDGEMLFGLTANNVFHSYDEEGTFTAMCRANGAETSAEDTLAVTVDLLNETVTPPANETNATPNGTNETTMSVDLRVTSSQDGTFGFICDATGFTPAGFQWDFGDGSTATTTEETTSHSFNESGDYIVSCLTQGDTQLGDAELITAQVSDDTGANETNETGDTGTVSVDLTVTGSEGRSFTFLCAASGFTPTGFQWDFGDGTTQTTTESSITHTYTAAGDFIASCVTQGETELGDIEFVTVT